MEMEFLNYLEEASKKSFDLANFYRAIGEKFLADLYQSDYELLQKQIKTLSA